MVIGEPVSFVPLANYHGCLSQTDAFPDIRLGVTTAMTRVECRLGAFLRRDIHEFSAPQPAFVIGQGEGLGVRCHVAVEPPVSPDSDLSVGWGVRLHKTGSSQQA